eukprot:15466119-Alexandrium_andersonii.AAC.1
MFALGAPGGQKPATDGLRNPPRAKTSMVRALTPIARLDHRQSLPYLERSFLPNAKWLVGLLWQGNRGRT